MSDIPYEVDVGYVQRLLERLISIPSVLPSEGLLVECLAETLHGIGIEPTLDDVAPGRPNLYAWASAGPGSRFLVLSGHSDTVAAVDGWETDPFAAMIQGDKLYGLGAINMKAGLACMMAAFRILVQSPDLWPGGRIGLAVTVDQEGHSIGARALLKTEFGKCNGMLHAEHFYGDTPSDYLPIAATGKVLYRVTVRGRAAHAFRPHLGGVNAVTDAATLITALKRLRMREHPLFGRGTQCVLRVEGGSRQYSVVVPEFCEIIITRLTVPGETRATAVRDMRDLIDTLSLEAQVEVDLISPCYEPYEIDPGERLLAVFNERYEQVMGHTAHYCPHRGIVDANVFVAEGNIPTIVFGPKGGNHHQAGEYVILSSLEPVVRVYVETARAFLSAES